MCNHHIEIKTIKYPVRGQKGFKEAQDEHYNAIMQAIGYHDKGEVFRKNHLWQNLINSGKSKMQNI